MSKIRIPGGLIGAIVVATLIVTAGCDMSDSGNDVKSPPVSESVSASQEECHDQIVSVQRPTQDPNQVTGTVTGAVVGGLVGNQIGDGDGKKVATAAGVIVGAVSGKKVQEGMQERNVDQVSQRVCEPT